jgi:two-component system, cell cycle sensor histidine kinase and response regulator CckA
LPRDVGSTTRETVGRLAGGIAHDFNNLLTVINGSADLALDLHDPPAAVREDLRQIREAGERAAPLTRQLLAFSRKQILPSDVVDVNRLIAGIEAMLKRLIGEHLQLVVAVDEEAGNVRSDAGQLEQVLLNLVVNARDAIPDGGTLAIRTQRLRLEPGDTRPPSLAQAGLQPGTHLVIAVSDTGVGMDEATRLRVFEPFYTTKEPERGTGLGLAMVHSIVMQTGGAIWVDSEPGAWATFSVCLPSTDEPAADVHVQPAAPRVRGRGTAPFVEDEPALNRLAARILSGAGYTVLKAADGVQALAILHAHGGGCRPGAPRRRDARHERSRPRHTRGRRLPARARALHIRLHR